MPGIHISIGGADALEPPRRPASEPAPSPPAGGIDVASMSDGTTRIALTGEIDLAVAESFTATLDALGEPAAVEIDLGPTTFMDSAGIGFLVKVASIAQTRPRLVGLNSNIALVLETIGVIDLFDTTVAEGDA